MLLDFAASKRTAVPVHRGVMAASLVSMLSTASLQSTTVFDRTNPGEGVAVDPAAAPTASDRLPSALRYSEITGSKTLPAVVAGRITPSTARSVDRKDALRERIHSIMMETDGDPNGPRPSPDAIDDALRFVELIPADAPAPHVSVADDGEVNFFRRGPGLFIDVGFFGDGQIHYYARVDALEIDVDGSAPFSGRSLPRDLVIPITTD